VRTKAFLTAAGTVLATYAGMASLFLLLALSWRTVKVGCR
jgi:hypothetical protein